MARTAITVQDAPGPYIDWATLTLSATDVGNGNKYTATGEEIIIAQNTDAGSQSITLKSVEDPYGRTEDYVKSMSTTAFAIIGPVEIIGYRQTDGCVYIDSTSANIKIAVIKIQ